MPVYEYVCTACGTQVEVMHGVHAAGPSTCAGCGGAMRKALSVPSIHFKGSGWAKKDARSSSGTAAGAKPAAGDAPAAPVAAPAAEGGSAGARTGTGGGSAPAAASGSGGGPAAG